MIGLLRAISAAEKLSDSELSARLLAYADEVERDTGRAYAPTFMREAAMRLIGAVREGPPDQAPAPTVHIDSAPK